MTRNRRTVPVLLIAAGIASTGFVLVRMYVRRQRLDRMQQEISLCASRVLPAAQTSATHPTYADHELVTATENLFLWAEELERDSRESRRDWLLLCGGQAALIGGIAIYADRGRIQPRS